VSSLPAHVVRFGPQVKAKGVEPGSRDVDRTIGYITKYVTKAAADCHTITGDLRARVCSSSPDPRTSPSPRSRMQARHFRLRIGVFALGECWDAAGYAQ